MKENIQKIFRFSENKPYSLDNVDGKVGQR